MIKEKSRHWSSLSRKIGQWFACYVPLSGYAYTLLSLVFAGLGVYTAYRGVFLASIGMFLLSLFMDIIDGAVARAQGQASPLGAFLDGTFDRFVDFAMLYAYFFFRIQSSVIPKEQLILLLSFVVIMPSFIVSYANHRHAVSDDEETLIWRLMHRAEMNVLMLLAMIVSCFNPIWAGYILIGLLVLASITILQTILMTIYYARKSGYLFGLYYPRKRN